jgi:hypothetical protein
MQARALATAAAAVLLLVLPAPAAWAQRSRVSPSVEDAGKTPAEREAESGAGRLALHAYAMHHRPLSEAAELVRPMLSTVGTIELQPARDTLVVRDTLAALSRIAPALRQFDRPLEPLDVEVLVVRALAAGDRPSAAPRVPPDLERRLRALLRYERYELVAEARLRSRENEEVTYELGGGYEVRFRVGSLIQERRVRLVDFQVARAGADGFRPPLIHTNLNVWLDRTVTLGLARTEGSTSALMVAVTCRRAGSSEVPRASELGGS